MLTSFTVSGQGSLKDHRTYHAVLRVLQTLSESAQKLPDDIKAVHVEVDWQAIGKARNYLVHDYLGHITPEILWGLIQRHLLPLQQAMLVHAPNWPDYKPA